MGSVNLLANRLAAEEAQGRYEEAVLPLTKELLAYCDRMAKSKQISFEEALAYRIGLLEEYGNQAEGETAYSEPLLRCMLEQGAGRDRDIGDRDKYYLVKLLYEYSHHLDEDRLGSLIDAVNATQDKALKRYFETLID